MDFAFLKKNSNLCMSRKLIMKFKEDGKNNYIY